jgi:hypothetical protein
VLFAVNIKKCREKFLFFQSLNKIKDCKIKVIELVERRIAAWMAAIGSNINKYYGTHTVCSLHFHSGMQSLQTKSY